MSRGTPRISDYLGHILEAIHRINHYTEDLTEAAFLGNELVQDAVIRNIEIMDEAAKNMERRHPDFSEQHPDVPWEDIYLMRNRVSHGYFSIDLEIVWNTIQNDPPVLERQVRELQQSMG